MTTPPSDSGLTGLAPGATTRGSTADGDKVVHDLSEQLTHVRVQDSRRADGGAEAEAGVARSVIGAGTPPAGVAQPEVDSVDEGSAPIHEPTQSDQLSSTPAQPSQSVSPPSTTGPNPVASSAPTTLSGPSLDQPQPARSTIHSVPDTQDGVVEDQLVSDEWLLKTIHWPPLPAPPSDATGYSHSGPPIKIIMQHRNGPCSLVALCNTLILRGDIHITAPPSRQTVTYDELSSLVANFLLSSERAQSGSMSAALSVLPSTRYGLEVNPRFGSIDGFRESSSATGELALFQLSGVPLVHGWVADPQSEEEWEVVVGQAGDYDAATLLLVQAAEITGGVSAEELELAGDDEAIIKHAEHMSTLNPDQSDIVRKAHILNSFLNSSPTQLTYHGLVLLSTQLAPSSLSALFRNSHLSTLYRRPSSPSPSSSHGPQLFTLVTDSAFAGEPDIVWESLEDVDGAASEFFDAALRPASLPRGDFVRRRADPREEGDEDGSAALARQLQREEEEEASRRRIEQEERDRKRAWEEEERRRVAEAERGRESHGAIRPGPQQQTAGGRKDSKKGKGKDCTIM